MQVTFIGNPNGEDDAQSCQVFGEVFFKGQPKDVSHLGDSIKKKLSENAHFAVGEIAPRRKPRKPDAPEPQDNAA